MTKPCEPQPVKEIEKNEFSKGQVNIFEKGFGKKRSSSAFPKRKNLFSLPNLTTMNATHILRFRFYFQEPVSPFEI